METEITMDYGSILAEPTTWIAVTIASLYFIYRLGTSTHRVFSDQGIPGPKPIPFIGTAWGMWKQVVPDHDREMAKKYGKVYGLFEGLKPNLRISDTELIRSVFVKDFDHFINRRSFEMPEVKVLRKMMTDMKDQEWKDVRSAVTPTFTSGKIKRYSIQIKECADQFCLKVQSIAATKGKLNLKEEMGKVTMAVIAKCAFGMTLDNLGEDNDPFMKNAKKTFASPENKSPSIMILFILPGFLLKYLMGKLFDFNSWNFFAGIMNNLVKERSKSNLKYHDFPEMASESISAYTKEENGTTRPMWNKEEVDEIVAAQATLFLVAGYDTTANTLTSACFTLARHPEIQEKLYGLVMSKIDQHGDICHEMLADLPYLDHVVNEVLRMHPPITAIERECNKEVTYKGVHIPKGMVVSVSTYALHYSEEYYADPETFNPDRWNSKNKANLNAYAFMPFGMGPRNCVAMRFALEEAKLVLCTLVKRFRFYPVDETPMKLCVDDGFNSIIQPINTTVGIAVRE